MLRVDGVFSTASLAVICQRERSSSTIQYRLLQAANQQMLSQHIGIDACAFILYSG